MATPDQATSLSASKQPSPALIEIRSIDYVPDAERHGGLSSQFTLWLAANLQITAIVTGALAVAGGIVTGPARGWLCCGRWSRSLRVS